MWTGWPFARKKGPPRLAELAAPWVLEVDGVPAVRLTGFRVPDQFWAEFDAAWITHDEALVRRMRDEGFWWGDHLVLRSELTGRTEASPLFGGASVQDLFDRRTLSVRGL